MKKLFKIIGIIIAIIIIVFVLAVVALVTLVNPNDFKGKISQVVQQKTGRELTIAGDINWSFIPLGIKVHDVSLSNAPQFKAANFAQVGEADISIRLLPLITGRIEAGNLGLKNFTLNLEKNRAGQTNWQDLTKPKKVAPKPTPPPTPEKKKAKQITLVSISGVDISNANIFWNDAQTGQTANMQNFEFHSKNITLQRPFKIHTSFDFQTTKPTYHGHLDLTSNILFNPNTQDFALKNLTAQIANLKINGNIEGNKIFDAPAFSGNINISTFNPKQFLKSLGQTIQTQDESALQKASATVSFQTTPNIITIPSFQVILDDSKLQGKVSKLDLKRKLMNFTLALNQINFNRYKLKTPISYKAPKTKQTSKSSNPSNPNNPMNPWSMWSANGNLQVNQLTLEQFQFSNIKVTMEANKGVIALSPITANFYGGTLKANTRVNITGQVPQFAMSASLANTKIDALLSDMYNIAPITGTANVYINFASQGSDTVTILKNLNGSGKAALKDGKLKNFNILYLLNLLSSKQFSTQQLSAGDTAFTNFSGSFVVKNGILTNNDLLITSPKYQLTGKGTANLVTQKLDYHLLASKLNGKQIPIKVTGTFAKPIPMPDFTAMTKQAVQKQQQKVKQKIQENIRKWLR
jgi:AsmA protein